jgi:hypothetical protein
VRFAALSDQVRRNFPGVNAMSDNEVQYRRPTRTTAASRLVENIADRTRAVARGMAVAGAPPLSFLIGGVSSHTDSVSAATTVWVG